MVLLNKPLYVEFCGVCVFQRRKLTERILFLSSQVDKDAELVAQWNYCTLSQEILRRPIVACELGRYSSFT